MGDEVTQRKKALSRKIAPETKANPKKSLLDESLFLS